MTTQSIDFTRPLETLDGAKVIYNADAGTIEREDGGEITVRRNGEESASYRTVYVDVDCPNYGWGEEVSFDIRNSLPANGFDASKPVQTRSGKPARIISTDAVGVPCTVGQSLTSFSAQQPILALVGEGENAEFEKYNADGTYFNPIFDRDNTSDYDLINIPEEEEEEGPVVTERFFAIYSLGESYEATLSEKREEDAVLLTALKHNDRPLIRVVYHDGEYAGAQIIDGEGELL